MAVRVRDSQAEGRYLPPLPTSGFFSWIISSFGALANLTVKGPTEIRQAREGDKSQKEAKNIQTHLLAHSNWSPLSKLKFLVLMTQVRGT